MAKSTVYQNKASSTTQSLDHVPYPVPVPIPNPATAPNPTNFQALNTSPVPGGRGRRGGSVAPFARTPL